MKELTIDSFEAAVEHSLSLIAKDAETDVEDIKEQLSRMTVKRLSITSPKKRGDYARSWKVKKTKDGYIIYNKLGQLTHLLEHGHPLVNKKGEVYGRAKAYPHIKDAESWMWKEAEIIIAKKFGGGK